MERSATSAPNPHFLPDLCGIRALFVVVVGAELLAFLLTLTNATSLAHGLDDLSITSLFVQWTALISAAVLCGSRRFLTRLPEFQAAVIAYAILLLVTGLVSETAWAIARQSAFAVGLKAQHHAEFILRNVLISALINALLLRYLYVQHHWRQRVQSESIARLQALQARIRPHFFFNCLNSIATLTRTDPALAEQAVEDLADLFRASLRDASQRITLAQEFEFCRQYLRIEALRLGDRLQIAWDAAALPPDALIPPLTVQPLIENAIYHGIEPTTAGGTIRLYGQRDGDRLRITIDNPVATATARTRGAGNQIALHNIRERLAVFFGGRALLETTPSADAFHVALCFPYESTESPDR